MVWFEIMIIFQNKMQILANAHIFLKNKKYSTNIDTKCNGLEKIWIFLVTCYKEFH